MNPYKVNDRMKHTLDLRKVRSLLVKYFHDKGVEDYDIPIYPIGIHDIVDIVPEISHRIEIEPKVEDVDPMSGWTRLGWNLFVLGNKRLYLGETEHDNANDLKLLMDGAPDLYNGAIYKNTRSPREIIKFIVRILENHPDIIKSIEPINPLGTASGLNGNESMWERPKAARPEA